MSVMCSGGIHKLLQSWYYKPHPAL